MIRIYPIHAIGIDRIKEVQPQKPIKVAVIDDTGFIIDGHHRYFRWWLNRFGERGQKEKELVNRIVERITETNIKDDISNLVGFFSRLDKELAQEFGKTYNDFFKFFDESIFPENAEVIHITAPVSVVNRIHRLVDEMHRGTVCWMPTVGAWIEDEGYSPYAFYFVPKIAPYKFGIRKNLTEVFRIFRSLKTINYEDIEIKTNFEEKLIPLSVKRIDKILSLVEAGAKVTIVDHIGSIYTDPTTGVTIRKEGNEYVVEEFAGSVAEEKSYSDIASVRKILEKMEKVVEIHIE